MDCFNSKQPHQILLSSYLHRTFFPLIWASLVINVLIFQLTQMNRQFRNQKKILERNGGGSETIAGCKLWGTKSSVMNVTHYYHVKLSCSTTDENCLEFIEKTLRFPSFIWRGRLDDKTLHTNVSSSYIGRSSPKLVKSKLPEFTQIRVNLCTKWWAMIIDQARLHGDVVWWCEREMVIAVGMEKGQARLH